jgi:streptomycin 6-kinase
MDRLGVPTNLERAARREGRLDWVEALPAAIDLAVRRWGLTLDSPYEPGGQCAWVAPARSEVHGEVVLKVGWPHPEAQFEAEGLRLWAGDGTVELLEHLRSDAADLLLLERCTPGAALAARPGPEQDEVITCLLRRLWGTPPPDHGIPSLQSMCDLWADEREEGGEDGLDPGVLRDGIALFRSLPASADREVLLATDLHAENVLAAEREPWLAVDPKPHVGDPAYDVLQHLLNRDDALHADPEGLARRVADLAGLDGDRVVQWLFARCVIESDGWRSLVDVVERLASR